MKNSVSALALCVFLAAPAAAQVGISLPTGITGATGNAPASSLITEPTDADLKLLSTATTSTVLRTGVYVDNDAPPQMRHASSSPCTLHSGAGDIGTQTPSLDGKCWVASPSSELDYREFGGDPSNVLDNSVHFDDFLAAVAASRERTGFISNGVWRFTAQPNCISTPVTIHGANIGATLLRRDYDGTAGTGLICFTSSASAGNPSGSVVRDLEVESTAGHTGGTLISAQSGSGATDNIARLTIENFVGTTQGDCTNDYSGVFDGTAATTEPIGIRNLDLKNVHFFGAAISSVLFDGVEGLTWIGGSAETAGCSSSTTQGIKISGTASVPTNYVKIDIAEALSGFSIDNAQYGNINVGYLGALGGVSVDNTSTATQFYVTAGVKTGSVLSNWTHSQVVTPP